MNPDNWDEDDNEEFWESYWDGLGEYEPSPEDLVPYDDEIPF
jgi:hypothetical protein